MSASPVVAGSGYSFENARAFLSRYCEACHQGEDAAADFRIAPLQGLESFRTLPDRWTRLAGRVSNSEMPPKSAPMPAFEERIEFLEWVETTWRGQACSVDMEPPAGSIRRLNRDEYSATIRDLFDLQLDVSERFPADGPGGEGFDNAAETLFISPLLTEKYVETAKFVVDAASKEFKAKQRVFLARPRPGMTADAAARSILANFLPRAFRRPVDRSTIQSYLRLFRRARRQGLDFEPAVFATLRSALASPSFLFHAPPRANGASARQYALASRLSYFLWGSMPDELLFDIAAAGRMEDPAVLDRLVPRMLRDDRALEFSTRFTEQWLRTRELEGTHGPDPELFPEFASNRELQSDIILQPVFFFHEVVRENRSLLDFLDSDGTILTRELIKHMDLDLEKKQDGNNPNWMQLPAGSKRGGLLTMPAVLALASHPHRTSAVLRGAWVLDSILGTPPPPPPPDVPELDEPAEGEPSKSVREMLARHSSDAACASCHSLIDPLGFALENYGVLGKWRDGDAGSMVDATATMADGTELDGPASLKAAMLERKELFVRNLARRMLGYALGRGLTSADACAVETIVDATQREGYSAWALIRQVAKSKPFLGH